MIRIVRLPDVEADVPGEFLHALVFQDDKLLIGRGFQKERNPFFFEDNDQFPGTVNGIGGDAAVKVVREQGVKLNAEEPAFGQ